MRLKHKINGNVIKASQEFLDANIKDYELDVLPKIINRPITNIKVSKDKLFINSNLSFDFVSELGDGNYYMPVMKKGDDSPLLFNTTISNGVGTLTVNFAQSGIYYIDNKMLDTDLQVNGVSGERFTLYVAQ